MFGWLRRLRSSQGFGIHSPFAYDFVVNVLREKYSYYAYENIIHRDHRLLYRIALALSPSELCGASLPPEVIESIRLGVAHSHRDSPFPLHVVTRDFPSVPPDGLSAPCALLFLDMDKEMKNKLRQFKESMGEHGMVFSNPRRAVVVADRRLPRQDFTINF